MIKKFTKAKTNKRKVLKDLSPTLKVLYVCTMIVGSIFLLGIFWSIAAYAMTEIPPDDSDIQPRIVETVPVTSCVTTTIPVTTTVTTVTTTKTTTTTVPVTTTVVTTTTTEEVVDDSSDDCDSYYEEDYEYDYCDESYEQDYESGDEYVEEYDDTYNESGNMTLLGNLRITGYVETGYPTASGVYPYVGGVAMSTSYGIPYGSTIYIEDLGYYTLFDTGCAYGVVDVFCNTVDECYQLTSWSNVYVVN